MNASWLALPLFIAVSFATSIPGIWARPGAWYEALDKPFFTPPGWVFGPAWTTLYVLMGVAAWRVWREAGFAEAKVALALFFVQLLFNAAWSPVFFGMRRMDLAFPVIVALWLFIAATIGAFAQHDRPAAWLLAPYLGWVTFASALNLALWRMNLDAVGR